MKKSLFYSLTFIFTLLALSCDKEDTTIGTDLDLIVGTYAPFCRNECTDLFKVKDGKVYAQANKPQFAKDVVYATTELANANTRALLAKLSAMPAAFNVADQERIGCPGCADQPILYLKFFEGEKTRELFVDIQEADLPVTLRPYVKELLSILDAL